jgi:predicted Rossmann fold flavoprotein
MMDMNNIAIIGGGASGMMASITAARSGAKVTLFEANDRVGKKILVTGNGRCNLSNMKMDSLFYESDDVSFVNSCINNFSTKETILFFESIGVLTKEKNGGLYPVTDTATTILDALRFALKRYQVSIKCNSKIKEICKKNDRFLITGCKTEFNKVIIATGLFASKNTEAAKYGVEIAEQLGHSIIKILPALVQLRCEGTYFNNVAGVRTNCSIRSFSNDTFLEQAKGELQLTNYGVSGIPVFQLSSRIARELYSKNNVVLRIDFVPWIVKEDIASFVSSRLLLMNDSTIEEFMNGIVHKKIIQVALNTNNISLNEPLKNISEKKLISVINLLKNWNIKVIKTNSFEQAQVCTGGIPLKEISPFFESKTEKNIYFIGELLNIDGICGGYNLQWAWTSGSIAGSHAALS